jgi:uncharacterized protein Yka (UPF0111/DUF47 family)
MSEIISEYAADFLSGGMELIKLRDIIESVEQAIDKAKDVSAVFKTIVSKRL